MKKIILIIFLASEFLFGDMVHLSNGNVIKGTIIDLNEDGIRIETGDGVLEVTRDKIVSGEFFGSGQEVEGNLVFEFLIDGNIKDTSGSGYKIKTKSIPYTEDRLSDPKGALLSKGEGEFFYIEDSSTISQVEEFTLGMDFYPEDTTSNCFLISNWENTYKDRKAEGRFSLSVLNRTVVFFVVDSNGYYQSIAASNVLNIKEWNSLAIRFGEKKMSIYVNGKTVAEQTISTEKLYKGSWPLYFMTAKYVGSSGVTDFRKYNIIGRLDRIRMWDSSLTDSELNLLYPSN